MAAAIALVAAAPASADRGHGRHGEREVRFATFNASVNRNNDGQLVQDLSTGNDPQLRNVAEIIQRARPEVLLINEFDFVPDQQAARLFRENYLSVPQNGARAIRFPFRFVAPSNTGIASGKDLDNNGQVVTQPGTGYGNDSFGFGEFPGQFGMAVYSRLPDRHEDARTFQHFLWKDMPGALLPDDPASPRPPTGTRPTSSTCSGSRRRATGTCRSRSATASACTSWSATRRRPSSTVPRTATAGATTTRSASGRTTSTRQRAATSTTTTAGTAA